MRPIAKSADAPPGSTGSTASGKLVILGILTIALAGAAVSWFFRYNATHKAARFWGGETATLIRDAPQVTLFRQPTSEIIRLAMNDVQRASFDKSAHDISHARGLVHLRNALLEDRNFIWPAAEEPPPNQPNDVAYWLLNFHDPASRKTAQIMFSEDCQQASRKTEHLFAYELTSISTAPIAAGLREMFAEFTTTAAKQPDDSAR